MTPFWEDSHLQLWGGDCREVLRELPDESVHCVVTSPPYWGLRTYDACTCVAQGRLEVFEDERGDRHTAGGAVAYHRVGKGADPECPKCHGTGRDESVTASQLGLEATPEEFVANMVGVFREVRRVLRRDGTLWLNLGDSYNSVPSGQNFTGQYANDDGRHGRRDGSQKASEAAASVERNLAKLGIYERSRKTSGLKPKDLVGIPWRVARALQEPYYTGTIKDEGDRIWLAAMIDAEGCLFLHKRKTGQSNGQGYVRKNDSYGAGMEVANTSLAIVERCMAIAGGRGSISHQDKGRNQRLYRWNMRSNECRDVIREVYPHLVAKQDQARLLLGCPSSGPEAEQAHASLMALHNGLPATIDFKPPASMFEEGWYLRSDIVWSKLNPMPESVTDRPTKAHEYLFLLTRSPRYYYDAEAVREPMTGEFLSSGVRNPRAAYETGNMPHQDRGEAYLKPAAMERGLSPSAFAAPMNPAGRNLRSVWSIATEPYPGAHFATFPRKLVEPCVKAGTSERGVCPECGAPWVRDVEKVYKSPPTYKNGNGKELTEGRNRNMTRAGDGFESITTTGWRPSCSCCDHLFATTGVPCEFHVPVPAVVLDPFAGSGTTLLVAQALGRRGVGIDLSPDYLKQALERNRQTPLGLVG